MKSRKQLAFHVLYILLSRKSRYTFPYCFHSLNAQLGSPCMSSVETINGHQTCGLLQDAAPASLPNASLYCQSWRCGRSEFIGDEIDVTFLFLGYGNPEKDRALVCNYWDFTFIILYISLECQCEEWIYESMFLSCKQAGYLQLSISDWDFSLK